MRSQLNNRTTLFFTDSHTETQDSLQRYFALGNYIAEHKPDTIISGGDFLTLDSLNTFDLNKRGKMEGKRFREEIEHGKRAINAIMNGILNLQVNQRASKKRLYHPKLVYIEGNHEERYQRYQDSNPEIKGILEIPEAIDLNKYGWEWVPYRSYYYECGCGFTHIPMNGSNQPLSGQRLHINAAMDQMQSIFYGHTHTLNVTSIARFGKEHQQVFAINGGMFSEEVPAYARGSKGIMNWWRGFLMIEHLDDKGRFDLEMVNLDKLLKEYG